MQKSYIYLLLAFFSISGTNVFAHGIFHESGEHHSILQVASSDTNSPYLDSNTKIKTVMDLKKAKDDEHVTLTGYIIKKIKHDKYLFKDSTGEITLEIDKKINNQLKDVNDKTLVEVYGEYDKEHFEENKVDVKKITIVNK